MDKDPRTVRVRIAVAVDVDREWRAAEGARDDCDSTENRVEWERYAIKRALFGMSPGARAYILTADLPIPDPERPTPEVAATVEEVPI